ncbi:hypothetical protein IM660_13915 [Ruania alkalisoli]|uniref:Uncharacterized protein n=1 Tax=Ruania alkalisoli TaxID=2779775 RepID=A0A7M1SSI3_9MICO|nr:hypothetical protein [Ruania alkalisoli]QOR69752.1 hypothetical protein IM660_13915 [Ruania alkalisoli]
MSDESREVLPAELVAILRCPVTGSALREDVGPHGEPVLVNEASQRPLAYPIRAGVPVLLAHEAVAGSAEK